MVQGTGTGDGSLFYPKTGEILFSSRERDIALLMAQGDTSKEISEKLFLSQGTVKNYMSNIYGKIGTSERAKAMIVLKELKL